MSTVSDSIVIQMIADNKKFMADMDKMWSKVDKKVDSALKGQEKTVDKSTKKMANSYKDMISVAATAFSAVYLKRFIESSISAASSLENMEARFKALYKEGNQAAEMFDAVVSHATKVPHTLQQVGEAGARLSAFGLDMKKWLPVVSDLASFMGEDVVFAASSLGRAFQSVGAADVFRERGILDLIADFKGLSSRADLAKLSIHEYRKAIHDALTDRGGKVFGSAIAQATTFSGQLSMLSDAFATFSKGAWDAGLGDLLKSWVGIMKDLTTEAAAFWREWAKNSEAAKKQKVAEREKGWLDALQLDKNQLDPAMKNMIQRAEELQDNADKLKHLIDSGLTGKVKETRHGPVYEKSSFAQQEIQLQELKVLEKNIKAVVDKIALYRDKLSIKPPKAVRLERSEEMRNEIQSSLALLSKEKDSLYAVKIAREKNVEAIKLLEEQIKTFSQAKHKDDIATRTALKEALTLRKAETVELEKQARELVKKNKEAKTLARRQKGDFTPQEREKQQKYIDEAFRISTLEVEIKPKEDPLVKAISEAWQQAGDDIGKTIAEAVTSGFDSGLGGVTAGIKKILTAPAEAMISDFVSTKITGKMAYLMSEMFPSSGGGIPFANANIDLNTKEFGPQPEGYTPQYASAAGAGIGSAAGGIAVGILAPLFIDALGKEVNGWFESNDKSMQVLRSAARDFNASVEDFSVAVSRNQALIEAQEEAGKGGGSFLSKVTGGFIDGVLDLTNLINPLASVFNIASEISSRFESGDKGGALDKTLEAAVKSASGSYSRGDLLRTLSNNPVTALEMVGREAKGLADVIDNYRENLDDFSESDVTDLFQKTMSSLREMEQIENNRLLSIKETFDSIAESNKKMLDDYIDGGKTSGLLFVEAADRYKKGIADLEAATAEGDPDKIAKINQQIVDSQQDMLRNISDKNLAAGLAAALKAEYEIFEPDAKDIIETEREKMSNLKQGLLQDISDVFSQLRTEVQDLTLVFGEGTKLGPAGLSPSAIDKISNDYEYQTLPMLANQSVSISSSALQSPAINIHAPITINGIDGLAATTIAEMTISKLKYQVRNNGMKFWSS